MDDLSLRKRNPTINEDSSSSPLVEPVAAVDTPQVVSEEKRYYKKSLQNDIEYRPFDFVSGEFLYTIRIVVLLLCSVFPVLALSGKYTISLLVSGFVVVYILDFLHLKKYTILAFWGTIATFWTSLYVSSLSLIWMSFFNIFVLMHASLYVLLFGIFGTLLSSWFRNWTPELTLTSERILFAALPIVSLPLLMSSVIAVNGVDNAAFYLAILMCLFVHMYYSPLRSSFKRSKLQEGAGSKYDLYIQKPLECKVFCGLTVVVPFITYVCTYHRMLAFSVSHFINMATLIAIPLSFFAIDPERYLWWGWEYMESKYPKLRITTLISGLLVIITWLEYRVIFRRYSYLLAIPPPFSYIVVTGALFSIIVLVALVILGVLGKKGKIASVFLCALATGCGSFALGFPIWMIPVASAAAYCGSAFYYTNSWKQYMVFCITATIAFMWWLSKSFWFIPFEFYLTILPVNWTLNINHTTFVICALFVLSLVAIPFCMKNHSTKANAVILVAQALTLAFLEQLLYEQGEGFYPPSLLLFTTGLGLFVSTSLLEKGRLEVNGASVLMAAYFAKLGIFLAPVRMALLAAFFTSLSFTRLYFASVNKESIKPTMGWLYVGISGMSLFLTRHVLLEKVMQYVLDTRYYAMTDSRILGLFLLAWGIAIMPLSYKFMRNVKMIHRLNIFLIIVGAVWAFIQPSTNQGDFDIVPWVVIFVVILTLANVLNFIRFPSNFITRTFFFTIIGLGAGFAFANSYLHFAHAFTKFMVCLAFLLAAYALYFSHFPHKGSYSTCLYLYLGLMATLPLTYFTLGVRKLDTKEYNADAARDSALMNELITTAQVSIMGVYTILNIFMAVVIKFKLSGRPLLYYKPAESGISIPGSDELAVVSNAATIAGYILAVMLTNWLNPKLFTFIMLASLFLLLNRDSQLLSEYTDQVRYTIVVGAVQLSSVVYFFSELFNLVIGTIRTAGFEQAIPDIIIHVGLLAMSAPAHYLFLKFTWKLKRPKVKYVLICLPFSILVWLIGSFESLYWMGVLGVLGSLLQIFTATQWSRQVAVNI